LIAAGIDPEEMWPRFDEGIRALRAFLDPELPPFKGRFYDTEGFVLEPRPAQKAHIPIWLGSWGSEAGLRRVARLAEGWIGSAGPGHQSPEQFIKDKERLDTYLVKAGKDPQTFGTAVSSMPLFISEDHGELERVGASSAGMARRRPDSAPPFLTRPAERSDEEPHAHDMVGTRAECIDKVRRWQSSGVGALFLSPEGPDPEGQLRIFIDEVASKA
jgi:alkanesulfonate monooxygenase SsuD/methylene tetrahydromethanopterin reductase-like flavin-dependent oxidoreductase (luciferase family)